MVDWTASSRGPGMAGQVGVRRGWRRLVAVAGSLGLVVALSGCQLIQWQSVAQGPVTSNRDGRLEFFAHDSNYHTWQLTPNGNWSAFVPMPPFSNGGGGPPEVARNADGRLEVFERDVAIGGRLWHAWQKSPGGSWSPWVVMSGSWQDVNVPQLVGDIAVAQNADGRLEVIAASSDGPVHAYQVAPNSGVWSTWAKMPVLSSNIQMQVTAAQNADGRLEVVAGGSGQEAVYSSQLVPNGGWSGWAPLPLPGVAAETRPFALAPNSDGRLEVFAYSPTQGLFHAWQVVPGGAWAGGAQLAPARDSISEAFNGGVFAAPNADGHLEVFYLDSHIRQTSDTPTGWSSPGQLAYNAGAIGMARNADGRLSAYFYGISGGWPCLGTATFELSQNAPNSLGWQYRVMKDTSGC